MGGRNRPIEIPAKRDSKLSDSRPWEFEQKFRNLNFILYFNNTWAETTFNKNILYNLVNSYRRMKMFRKRF